MKRLIAFILVVIAFSVNSSAQEQFRSPQIAWGLSAGGAHGSNISGDSWVMQYRAFLQYEFVAPMLMGQLGLGYTGLRAPGVYSAQTGIGDFQLLFSPFTLTNLNPYLYGGVGLSKRLNTSGSDYLPMAMMGAGVQTRVSNGILLNVNGGYNLSLSDKFDGQSRTTSGLNVLTNEKQDGFYGFTIGLAFTIGSDYTME